MPKPRKGEKESEFIPRCIRIVMREGKEREHAVAICYGIWKQHRKRKKDEDE